MNYNIIFLISHGDTNNFHYYFLQIINYLLKIIFN